MAGNITAIDEGVIGSAVGSPRVNPFDASYYATGCGPKPYARNDQWLAFFGGIADEIIRSLRPSRVFDAGCAMGMLVESLWDRGVPAWGADISPYAISMVRRDMQPYCRVASITEPLSGNFDLVTCIEVLEHMPEADARLAIDEMTKASDVVLFSSTPDDFVEPTHINVHPIIYWLKLFEEHGFQPDLTYDAGFISPHAILFRKTQQRFGEDVVALFARKVRFKIALVEREQRIGALNEQLAKSEAALREAESGLAQLQLEKTAAEQAGAELDATRTRLREAGERIASLEASGASLEALVASNAVLEERLRMAGDAREVAERNLAEVNTRNAARTAELETVLARGEAELKTVRERALEATNGFAALEAENTALRQQNMQLAETSSELKSELVAIHQSPGWRLILRYRNWFYAARGHSGWIRRWYEPAAARLLARLTRKGSDPALPEALNAMQADEASLAVSPSAASESALRPYGHWIRANEPSLAVLRIQRQISRQFAYRPKISIVVPVYKVPRSVLSETIESVLSQTYDHWELCVVHADPEGTDGRASLSALSATDERIKVELLDSNLGISGNSSRAFSMSTGEFIALLDHDDTLAPSALFEVAAKLNQDPSLDFIYSDKDQLSEDGTERLDPLFKPAWSPDLVLSANYLTHLCVLRAAIVRSIGGWHAETDGAQDWDLFLRAIGESEHVAHIPKVLYHWRRISTSVSTRGLEAKPYAAAAQLSAVGSYLVRRGWKASAAFTESGLIQLRWNMGLRPRASIIILGNDVLSKDDEEDLSNYAAREFPSVDHPELEVFLVPSSGTAPAPRPRESRMHVVPYDENASLASRLNDAIRQSSGEVLIFVDQCVKPSAGTWLDEMIAPLQQPGVGVTGCKLFDLKTCRIRHAGICFNSDGELAYPFASETDYIHNAFGGANWYRNWLAVSGACFAIRRDVFESVGGFSLRPAFPRLDVDLCLKVFLDTGTRVFYNPFARMWQTRRAVLENWLQLDGPAVGARYISSSFPSGDPFFNPNLVAKEGSILLRKPGDWRARAVPDHNYAKESRLLVKAFDCVPAEIQESIASCSRASRRVTNHFTWFIPEFRHPFYGGIHTVFRFADYFRRAHDIRSSFVVLGHAHPATMRRRIAAVSDELASSSAVEVLDDYAGLSRLEPTDAAIATLWTTAYYLLRYNQAREKFYFLQDHESLFYPAGSTSALVDATWNFGFKGLCNTVTLRDLYVRRGGEAEFFVPCVDRDVFYPRIAPGDRDDTPYTLFCYARPNHARNCFELLVESLRILKRRLGEKVDIVTAGEHWDPAQFGADGLMHNLGVLDYRATGALYRACDAGVIMMTTAHPSYLPLELMACGSLVVTNQNPDTSWLLEDRVNCLLAQTTPGALAEAIEEGLRNHTLRRDITEKAAAMVEEQYQDWDGAAEKVFRYLRAGVEDTRR